jgi:hypothetical protein
VANGNGLYRFPALAPGEYQLVFTLDGFTTLEREGIYVGVGLTVTIDVEMHIATLQQKVTVVRNSPVIDQQSAAIVTTFDSHQLANLPGGRSMWAIQAATPAVYLPRFDLGATATGLGTAISAYGTAGSNRPMVEGISTSGINPTGFTLDYGVFEEVSVGTAAYGPEWPWSGVQMQFISLRRGRPADTTRGKLKTSIAGRGDPRPLVFGIRSNRVTPVELQQEFNETFTRGPSWSPYSDLARRAALESGEARDRKVEGAGARQQGLRPGEFDPER